MFSLKKHFEKHAFPSIMTYLAATGFLRLLANLTTLRIPFLLSLLLPFLCILIIRLLDSHREYIPAVLVTAGLLLSVVLYAYYKSEELSDLWHSFLNLWINTELEPDYPWLAFAQLLLLSLFISLPVYFLQQNFLLRTISCAVQILILVLLFFFHIEPEKTILILFFGYLMFVLFEFMHRRTFPGPEDRQPVRTLYLYPAVLLLLITITLLPHKEEPIKWTLVKNMWASIVRTVDTISTNISLHFRTSSHIFEISFTGYSEDGDLGGNVRTNKANTLILTSSKLISQPVYLFGNQKNNYTGNGWTLTLPEDGESLKYKEYILDTLELLYAVHRAGFDTSDHDVIYQNLFKSQDYNIAFNELLTTTVFYPSKTRRIVFTNTNTEDLFSSNLSFAELQGPNTAYSVSCLELNLGSPEFDLLMNTTYSYDNSFDVNTTAMTHLLRRNNITEFTNDFSKLDMILLQRSTLINQSYLSLPDTLPDRVKALALEITKDAKTDYEKLLAIEAYLQTLTYTLTPGSIPKNEDAVDYFLFETQEGYCTYFATAMAVLSRCLGIPSRYVQGYCLRPQETSDFIYYVNNSDAHAWPECYLQGIGWIPFEPTPGYSAARYHPWHYAISQAQGYEDNYDEPEITDVPVISIIPEELELPDTPSYKNTLLLSLMIPAALLLFLFCYLLIKVNRAKNAYRHLSDERKMASNMAILYDLSNTLNIASPSSETLQDHFEHLAERFPELSEQLAVLCEQYMRFRYGSEKTHSGIVNEATLGTIDFVRDYLLNKCRQEKSYPMYLTLLVKLTLQYKILPVKI